MVLVNTGASLWWLVGAGWWWLVPVVLFDAGTVGGGWCWFVLALASDGW